MRVTAIDSVKPGSGGRLRVRWRSRSRVHRIDVLVDGVSRAVVEPRPGDLSCVVDVGPAPPQVVRIAAAFDGPEPSLELAAAASPDPRPERADAAFAEREAAVAATKDTLQPHRWMFVALDRETHPDLQIRWRLPPVETDRRRRAIGRMGVWIWRRTLLRAAARAGDVDASVPRWPEFDADLRYLSTLLFELLEPCENIVDDAFERFANGELVLGGPSQQGGPDGAYYTSFAGFAIACIEHAPLLPADQVAFWRRCLPLFVRTLHVFGPNYRRASGRSGRFDDFAVGHFTKPLLTDAQKEELRTRFPTHPEKHEGLYARDLAEAVDRWVVANLPEEVNERVP